MLGPIPTSQPECGRNQEPGCARETWLAGRLCLPSHTTFDYRRSDGKQCRPIKGESFDRIPRCDSVYMAAPASEDHLRVFAESGVLLHRR